jgi:8-amino-7-oxononanoate synthase
MTNDSPLSDLQTQFRSPVSATEGAFWDFSALPAYKELQSLKRTAAALGLDDIYFRPTDGPGTAQVVIDGRPYLNFLAHDYLDLAAHPEVRAAAADAVERYGLITSPSRVLGGERSIYREMESALAELHDVDDAVLHLSGYITNMETLGHLFGPRDLVLHDALAHKSQIQGALLSGAQRMAFPHNDWRVADALLARHRASFERAVILIEGLYSMDGDIPDLPRFVELRRKHKTLLMIDEAASIGILGPKGLGIREHFGLAGSDVDIWMGTLTKTFSTCGGYIAGSAAVIEYLRWTAPASIYTMPVPPGMVAAGLAAIRILLREPERVARLRALATRFSDRLRGEGFDVGSGSGLPIVPVIVGSSLMAARLAAALFERQIYAGPVIYPAVEENKARVRFLLSCGHTEAQLDEVVQALIDIRRQWR